MKHIKNYTTVKKAVTSYYKKKKADFLQRQKSIDKIKKDHPEWLVNNCQWEIKGNDYPPFVDGDFFYDDRKPDIAHSIKSMEKDAAADIELLDLADKVGRLREMRISVEWKPNRTWGANPRADIWMSWDLPDNQYEGCRSKSDSVGGCGYDKESTAVQGAINRLSKEAQAVLLRMAVEAGEKTWKVYAFRGVCPLPFFEIAGKGMSTFTYLFPRIGDKHRKDKGSWYAFPKYLLVEDTNGKMYSSYRIIREDLI